MVDVATSVVLGKLQVACGISNISVKAVCRLCGHKRCSLFLYAVTDYSKKLESLCTWMKLGKGLSETQHLSEAVKVKASYGIKVRGASAFASASVSAASSSAGPSSVGAAV